MWQEIFHGLPRRVELWLNHLRWWSLSRGCLIFFAGALVAGIVGGVGFDFWKQSFLPWLGTAHTGILVTNGLLVGIAVLLVTFLLAMVGLVLIYAANRRRIGAIEQLQAQRARLEERQIQLGEELPRLQSQISHLSGQLAYVSSQLELKRKQTALLDLLYKTDRELFVLFTGSVSEENVEQRFMDLIFRRTFALFENGQVQRASVYTLSVKDPELLTIRWDAGVGHASRWWNEWYVGPKDPSTVERHRGIPGTVFVQGKGRAVADVRKDPDFWDPYVPQREYLPYNSAVYALIHPNDEQQKQGVLCLDSKDHVFTDEDLALVSSVATRIGWFLHVLKTR